MKDDKSQAKKSVWRRFWPKRTLWKVLLVAGLILTPLSVGSIYITSQNQFCNSCHIMNDYYASWQMSPHSEVDCLACHVQPGFSGFVQGKINGLAQAIDCAIGRISTKPSATVSDSSCLRSGCHIEMELDQKPAQSPAIQKARFTHKGHLQLEQDGIAVSCGTCHGHFEGDKHFSVDRQVCYTCHFLKASPEAPRSVQTPCLNCHAVPKELFETGTLRVEHAAFSSDPSECQRCHKSQVEKVSRVPERACLNCHDYRKPKQFDSQQLHAKHFQGEKIECHSCHQETDHGFLASQQGYSPYEGNRFHRDFPRECQQCHREPHRGQFEQACDSCHNPQSWKAISIRKVHGMDSDFTLQGRHTEVACKMCHKPARADGSLASASFVNLSDRCADCHADPHGGQFARNCERCHTEQGWENSWRTPLHERNGEFPLDGNHTQVSCVKCHKPAEPDGSLASASFVNLSSRCADCHTDPHGGQFARNCERCHTEQGWKAQTVKSWHDPDSSFPLREKHSQVACRQCHRPPTPQAPLAQGKFVNLSHDCQTCHNDPHQKHMSHSCATCHSEAGFDLEHLLFSHNRDAAFPLDALHARLDCRSCHESKGAMRFRPLPQSCDTCHADIAGFMQGKSTRVSSAAHPHFGRVACTDCHDVQRPRQTAAQYADRCASCHNEHYRDLYYQWSLTWQTQEQNIDSIRKNSGVESELENQTLEAAVQQARSVNFHNIELSQTLWRAIEEEYR